MVIKINNDQWDLRLVSGNKKKMNPSENDQYIGLTEYVKGVINIREHMPRSLTRSTVIHELIHAFLFSYGCTVEGEEAMCHFFGAHADQIMLMTDEIMKVVGNQCCQ